MREEPNHEDVLAFWLKAGPERWFTRDDSFDAACRDRFLGLHEQAAASELSGWERRPDGALALVILLDQMPRNMFRDSPRTWATDPMALAVAERALASGFDAKVAYDLRPFYYLPFMHAESVDAQTRSVALYEALGAAENLKFARHHHDIVARFGRFPHRNEVLGRRSTPEELVFLETDPFRG